jgi:hypothetical protein
LGWIVVEVVLTKIVRWTPTRKKKLGAEVVEEEVEEVVEEVGVQS